MLNFQEKNMNKAFFAFPVVVLSLTAHLAFAADDSAASAAGASAADASAKQAKQARIFKAADTNGDGGLSRDELAKTTSLQFDIIKANFEQMDINKDGKVTPEERDTWVEAQRKAQLEQMDANHDGTVTPEERDAWVKKQRYLFGK
jgi:hypothetical protein